MATSRREFECELPVGFLDEDGAVQRTAVLRKMTGRDEAVMSDKRYRNNGARMVTELLGNCLVRLGALEKPGPKVARDLYSADRHYLLVKLREITFGGEMEATYTCPTCREATPMVEDLASLSVTRLHDGQVPEDVAVELADGYVGPEGEVHERIVFRYPTGTDEEKIASAARENPTRGRNALMARCLRGLGTITEERLQTLGTSIFDSLTLSDRAEVDKALNEGGPGVRMRREVSCSGCGRTYTAALDLSNFLRPS